MSEEIKDTQELELKDLKSQVYDKSIQIQIIQHKINELNQEINKRIQALQNMR